MHRLRVVIADDERPARSYLTALLRGFDDIDIVGEAEDGLEAVRVIETAKPDLALLDLQMPELDGLGVARMVRKSVQPLVVFVTAFDEYAVTAFELNAVDYLPKPVDAARLREALTRAHERLDRKDLREESARRVEAAAAEYDAAVAPRFLERIPVRRRDEILIVPVAHIASIVADGELLHLTTTRSERHTITYRLKDLAARLDPARFVRLGRGAVAAIDLISRVHVMPGGTHLVILANGQELPVSRIQSRVLRERLFKL
jgi:two-component system, LytTR family, response regulator